MGLEKSEAASLRRWLVPRLLDWFARHRRSLPWRRDRDPYRIWVSEVMLQQTQVAAVIPFFERFLQAFPTLTDLARRRRTRGAAPVGGAGLLPPGPRPASERRELLRTHGGRFPDDPAAIGRLPGFGRYTRNAVLSQAFDRRLPILEANSQRVLSRLFGRRGRPASGPGPALALAGRRGPAAAHAGSASSTRR